MLSVLHDERRSFAFFLLLLLVTAPLISYSQFSPSLLGILGIIWGVFGFLRLLYVTSFLDKHTSKILTLPSQLLFGLGNSQSTKIVNLLERLTRSDVLLFLCSGVFFIIWMLFCSFYPADITIIKDFNLKQDALLNFSMNSRVDVHIIASSLSFYVILGVIILSALSYSQSRMNVRWAFFSILPVFMVSVFLMVCVVPMVSIMLWPDLNVLKGGGLGQGDILQILSPGVMQRSGSGLIHRFTEGGVVGAYGAYILCVPSFIFMVKTLLNKRRTSFRYVVGLIVLIVLVLIDIFWLSSIFSKGLLILGGSLVALCWGAAGRRV